MELISLSVHSEFGEFSAAKNACNAEIYLGTYYTLKPYIFDLMVDRSYIN